MRVTVEILPDLEAVSRRAAQIFVGASQKAIGRQGRFAVALSGGSTPKRFYSLLASPDHRSRVDWSSVHFFWVDERAVPPDDEQSNFNLAREALLTRIHVKSENLHRIIGEEDPEKGAARYEEEIRRFFGDERVPAFDLVCLGMGEDGHTASLFPGSTALEERSRLAVPVRIGGLKTDRVTLTLPVLNNAIQVVFLVSGAAKSETVHRILGRNERSEGLPASLVRPIHGTVTWLLDGEAAGRLAALSAAGGRQ